MSTLKPFSKNKYQLKNSKEIQFTILTLIPSVDFNRKFRKNCGVPNKASKNTARKPIVSI